MEQHTITWRHVEIEITFTPEKFGMVDHIELRTKGKAALPVTETGYRSHYVNAGTVEHHGGAVAFVTAWLDHKAERTGWDNDQMSLFCEKKIFGWPFGQPLFCCLAYSADSLYHAEKFKYFSQDF